MVNCWLSCMPARWSSACWLNMACEAELRLLSLSLEVVFVFLEKFLVFVIVKYIFFEKSIVE